MTDETPIEKLQRDVEAMRADIRDLGERIWKLEDTITDAAELEEDTSSPITVTVQKKFVKVLKYAGASMASSETKVRGVLFVATLIVTNTFTFLARIIYDYWFGHQGHQ
jgi:hypothetical protein